MSNYQNKKVLILGMGKSGKSMVHFFKKREAQCLAFDDNRKVNVYEDSCNVYDKIEDIDFDQIDLLATSPGVSPKHTVCMQAQKKGIPIKGEMQLGLESISNRIIGITGTNGKSTLTSMIAHLLNSSSQKARAVGNIGVPITSVVDELSHNEIVVVELSSYQIDSLESPCLDYALLLNITPDHLDRYGNMQNYAKSKFSIVNFIKERGTFITSRSLISTWKGCFSFDQVMHYDDLLQKYLKKKNSVNPCTGPFQEQNFSAALAVSEFFGLTYDEIKEGIETFKGLAHRCEFVETFNGVSFYNDSKATNIESVIKAVTSINCPIHLIMGGDDKDLDYSILKPYFLDKVKGIYFIGQSKEKMAKVFEKEYTTSLCSSLESAMRGAFKKCEAKEALLLSPGTSSFCMFDNFEHRGEEFKHIVKLLEGEK